MADFIPPFPPFPLLVDVFAEMLGAWVGRLVGEIVGAWVGRMVGETVGGGFFEVGAFVNFAPPFSDLVGDGVGGDAEASFILLPTFPLPLSTGGARMRPSTP